jgi:hypothetical protein
MAFSPAVANDLVVRSLVPLSAQELAVATVKLQDAFNEIVARVPSVVARLEVSPQDLLFRALVVQVQVAAVLRWIKNPDGKYQEAGDDYSFSRDKSLAAGEVYITDAEVALLSPISAASAQGAFTIRPSGWRF